MKAIQWFVIAFGGLIVLVFATLFFLGRRPGAGRVGAVVELNAPPATAIAWLTEPAKLRRWVGYLTGVKGDTSAAVGAKQTWIMDDGRSGALTMSVEVTAFAPPDSLRRKLSVPGLMWGENRFVLERSGSGTRLTVAGLYHHPNPMVALLEPLLTPGAQAKLDSDLARLRAQFASATDGRAGAPADTSGATR
ncbi:MAG: SRPBCC family protein [Candidatus Eisenbacteria bacterium]|nr:SRPBCC family protein [Candidatus Eisenbacteria bacterium]